MENKIIGAPIVTNPVREEIADDLDISQSVRLNIEDDEFSFESVKNTKGIEISDISKTFKFQNPDKDGITFGNSKISMKSDSDTQSALDIFNMYRREGLYEDVYLPMTNVAVRIYEFANTDFSIVDFTSEAELDINRRIGMRRNNKVTQTRNFVEKIFDNSEFLTSDGPNLSKAYFEYIAAQDIPLLILAAAKLLNRVKEKLIGQEIPKTFEHNCTECNTRQEITLPIDSIVSAQYTEEMLKYADKNYDPLDTFENNINRGKTVKTKGVRFKQGNVTKETRIWIKEPTWIRNNVLDDEENDWILSKWGEHEYFKEVTDTRTYIGASDTERVNMLARKASNDIDMNNIQGYTMEFFTDQAKVRICKYISTIKVVNLEDLDENGKPKAIFTEDWNESDITFERKMATVSRMNDKLRSDLNAKIETMVEEGIANMKTTYECENNKCSHKNEVIFDPVELVFLILRPLTEVES